MRRVFETNVSKPTGTGRQRGKKPQSEPRESHKKGGYATQGERDLTASSKRSKSDAKGNTARSHLVLSHGSDFARLDVEVLAERLVLDLAVINLRFQTAS